MEKEFIAQVERLAESLVESVQMVLIDVEFRREHRGRVLRVYVDKHGGVTLDDCTTVSNQLSDLLDVKTDIQVPYYLEVSSPGLDCHLTKEKHFEHFRGRNARVKTRSTQGEIKSFRCTLAGIVDGRVSLSLEDGTTTEVPYNNIISARLDER